MTGLNQQLVEAVARLAERLWRVHPKEVMDTGLTRQQFYEREIGDLVAAAIQATDGKYQRLRSVLEGIKWKSADRDNMEFTARITYFQMDKILAALKEQSA